MTRSRRLRAGALALFLAAGTVGLFPAPSAAEAPDAVGWWSRRVPFTGDVQGQAVGAVRYQPRQVPDPTIPVPTTVPGGGPVTTLPLPVPLPTIPPPPVTLPPDPLPGTPNPTVPDGGLWVANDLNGAVAMSAIRFRGDIGSAELRLDFAPGSTTAGPVVACPMLTEFTPGPAGSWNDRPAHDCDRMSLSGRLNSAGTGMEFSIPQGFLPFGERVLDIALLAPTNSGDVFSLYFQAPGAASLEIISDQSLPPSVPDLPELDVPIPDVPGFSDTGTFTGTSTFDTGGGSGVVPDSGGGGETAAPQVPRPIAEIFEPFTESRFARILAVAVLLGMGAGLWYFGGGEVRPPRLLGAMAGETPVIVNTTSELGRGIGRFRRERLGPPPRL